MSTPRADQQIAALRKTQRRQLADFLDQLKAQGCAVLGYRLTGDDPLGRICVKHLGGQLRVVVAFASRRVAWLLLVGPHDDSDPGIDVYAALYWLVGFVPPDTEKRRKPPCCDNDGLPPVLDAAVEQLVDRAVRLRHSRRR